MSTKTTRRIAIDRAPSEELLQALGIRSWQRKSTAAFRRRSGGR